MDITYTNFWPQFNTNRFWLNKCIPKDCNNIIISSVFMEKSRIYELLDKKKLYKVILFSFENLYNNRYSWILQYLSNFHLVLGINDINLHNYIRVPYYFSKNVHDSNNLLKEKDVCMVSKNPSLVRSKLIHKFTQESIKVDCGGSLYNNIGHTVVSKHDFLLPYHFNICPENSYAKGYCTEKIYQALNANCIPIYWGDIDKDSDIINKNKILYINRDLSNLENIVQKCKSMLKNKEELNSYLEKSSYNMSKLKENNLLLTNQIITAFKNL